MLHYEVFANPSHQVIFKRPFDDLMEEVGRNEVVNVSAREVVGERL